VLYSAVCVVCLVLFSAAYLVCLVLYSAVCLGSFGTAFCSLFSLVGTV
jgi:hypothetical protein